jgi:hypothetical protein
MPWPHYDSQYFDVSACNPEASVNPLPFHPPPSTITAIYPNPLLLASAAEAVTSLLRSPSHNLRYVGLDALAGITRISPKYAMEHQVCG